MFQKGEQKNREKGDIRLNAGIIAESYRRKTVIGVAGRVLDPSQWPTNGIRTAVQLIKDLLCAGIQG